MAQFIQDKYKMIREMVLEYIIINQAKFMLVNGKIIYYVVKENMFFLTEKCMKV